MRTSYLSLLIVCRIRFANGCKKISKTGLAPILFGVFIVTLVASYIWLSLPTDDPLTTMTRAFYRSWLLPLAFLVAVALPLLVGTPSGSHSVRTALYEAGIVNHNNDAPYLLERKEDPRYPQVVVLVFYAANIAQSLWEDLKLQVEAALGSAVARIEYGETADYMIVHAAKAGITLPRPVAWDQQYLPKEHTLFTLGVSYLGPYMVVISNVPHLLLGGETGSGKSQLMKLLLAQAIMRGDYDIVIVDYKGGVDYGKKWRSHCQMCFDNDTLLKVLREAVNEISKRMELFSASYVSNLEEYNAKNTQMLRGKIIAFDELAEATNMNKCLTKSDKEKVTEIIGLLSSIARLARFADIHLFAATQSPLVDVLPSQIRNNLGFRSVGRCDETLSRVVIGKSDAATLVPKYIPGRFLTNDGTQFQAYKFSDDMLP